MKRLYQNSILLVIVGSIIGFVCALSIFFFEDSFFIRGHSLIPCPRCHIMETKGIMNRYPDFFTWIMLFTIHTGAALGLGLAAYHSIQNKILSHFHIEKPERYGALILVIIMMVISSTSYIIPFNAGKYYDWPVTPLNHQWTKIILLLSISILSAACAVMGLILTGYICMKLTNEEVLQANALTIYFELKEEMERLLMITGYILSSGMITVNFFKATEKSMGLPQLFDEHALTMFGLMFTIFVAITFIPCKLLLADLGRRILYQKVGSPPAVTADLKNWIETNAGMEKYLELKFDLIETFRYAIPVLAPILSALLPAVFHAKG